MFEVNSGNQWHLLARPTLSEVVYAGRKEINGTPDC